VARDSTGEGDKYRSVSIYRGTQRMTLIKENKTVRKEIPNRMMSATFALPIDGRRVVGIVNYTATDSGLTPLAFWIKLKPTDSYLDRELRASGKLISRCLQHGESLKELVDTLSQDNVIGQMAKLSAQKHGRYNYGQAVGKKDNVSYLLIRML
jgi:hypothetical protein